LENTCAGCGTRFTPRDEHQHYCLRAGCQRARKRKWQRDKLATDMDYRLNQADAQKVWREKHPDYWRDYRTRHPGYLERNRTEQRRRNGLRKKRAASSAPLQSEPVIAKMDAGRPFKSGTYRIIPLDGSLIAKMDSAIVELSLVSTG
jgi:hypothetical protein